MGKRRVGLESVEHVPDFVVKEGALLTLPLGDFVFEVAVIHVGEAA